MIRAILATATCFIALSLGASVARPEPSSLPSVTPFQALDGGPFRTPQEKTAYYSEKLREGLARNRSIHGPGDPRSSAYYPTLSKTIDFAFAPNIRLSPAQVDRYIDPRITGAMRAYVRDLMLQMPVGRRHNVRGYLAGVPSSTNAYANTWEDLEGLRCCFGRDLHDGTVRLYDGRVIPIPHPNEAVEAKPADTGVYAQIKSPPGFSAEDGYLLIPYCSWMYAPAVKSGVPFYTFGGFAKSSYIDSGLEWDVATSSVRLFYRDSTGTVVSGSVKIPCLQTGQAPLYDHLTMGIVAKETKKSAAQWMMTATEVNENLIPTGVVDVVGPLAAPLDWSVACSACTMKREIDIARQPANLNSGTRASALNAISPAGEARVPEEFYAEWTVGQDPDNAYASAEYLGGSYILSPATIRASHRWFYEPGADAGSDTEGLLLQPCVAPCTVY